MSHFSTISFKSLLMLTQNTNSLALDLQASIPDVLDVSASDISASVFLELEL